MGGGGESRILAAVSQLGQSLDFSAEASMHGSAALENASMMFAAYRFVFGDEFDDGQSSRAEEIVGSTSSARELIRIAMSKLELAGQSIRDYSNVIAPNLGFIEGVRERNVPAREALLSGARRPRNIKQATTEFLRNAEDAVGVATKTKESAVAIGKLLRPPEVTGTAVGAPVLREAPDRSPAAAQDPVLSIVVDGLLAVKFTEILARRAIRSVKVRTVKRR